MGRRFPPPLADPLYWGTGRLLTKQSMERRHVLLDRIARADRTRTSDRLLRPQRLHALRRDYRPATIAEHHGGLFRPDRSDPARRWRAADQDTGRRGPRRV